MDSDKLSPSPLEDLSIEELENALFDRLCGVGEMGPPVDERVGDQPYFWLRSQYRLASNGLRDRMTEVFRKFLRNLIDGETWHETARAELLYLLQSAGAGVVPEIRKLVDRRTLLDDTETGQRFHAALLKCLINLNHHANPDFWLKQFECLGPEYGALVFSGLTGHGLDVAMSHLAQLSRDPHARQHIVHFLPVLVDRHGLSAVADAVRGQLTGLEDTSRVEFEAAFESLGYFSLWDAEMPSTIVREELRRFGKSIEVRARKEGETLATVEADMETILAEADTSFRETPFSGAAPTPYEETTLKTIVNVIAFFALYARGPARNAFLWCVTRRMLERQGYLPGPESLKDFLELVCDPQEWESPQFRPWFKQLVEFTKSVHP